jgi:putative PEP-CTERM system integral membrane protein
MTAIIPKRSIRDNWALVLFWSWNLIFLAFMTLGFAPRMLPELVIAVRTGIIPASYFINALILAAIPIIAIILGLTVLRGAPARLFALGYVVEGPLMLLLAIRLFFIREATPAITLVLLIAGLGMAAFLWYVLDPATDRRGPLSSAIRLIGLTLMLLVSIYASIWIAFYALPLIAAVFQFIIETLANLPRFLSDLSDNLLDLFLESLIWVPFTILGFVLLLFTATLFVLTPIAVPWLSASAWWRSLKSIRDTRSWVRPTLLVTITLLVCILLSLWANQQPQHKAFALLENPPNSADQAQSLLDQQDSIRSGLLNAYLAPFRYLSAFGEVFHVRSLYRNVFDMNEENAAAVQNMYERLATPMLYSPVQPFDGYSSRDNVAFQREPQQAAKLYQKFFDQTIVEGERQEIVHAVRNTWSLDQAEAAWQAVDEREVYLLRQEIHIREHNDWAEVELYEVYQNQTAERQEVIYYFNLPESAVLTGVWLGNSPDRGERFVYQVAPRGAAQAVYRNETLELRDPALLEQIGPRQYRLRAFPVMPVRMTWNGENSRTLLEEAPPLYLWMTYQVLATEQGWPMPRLALKRNIFWDKDTVRLLNSDPLKTDMEKWLPASIPTSTPVTPQSHQVDLPDGHSVLAVPASQAELSILPDGLHLAVVLDRSHSMTAHADLVAAELIRLQESAGVNANIDIYLTASSYRGEAPSRENLTEFDTENIVYFGGQNAAELLAQYEELRADDSYDAVLVFTDGSGYELGENEIDVPIPAAPVWMVHLGSDLPLGYDDDTLEAIQASGGGVVGNLDQALSRLAVAIQGEVESIGVDSINRDLIDGYVWTVLPPDQAGSVDLESPPEESGFIAFAARRLILAEMQRHGGDLSQVSTLDNLHALAQEYSIVTPYSSMIVLVNLEQQRLLDHLAEGSDRYEREFEQLKDTVPSTNTPLTGVPEPHEWLLIGLAVIMLLLYASRRKLAWLKNVSF